MSKKAKKLGLSILVRLIIGACVAGLLLTFTPSGRRLVNSWAYSLQKAEDATGYDTRRQVEESCRAMQASYQADRLTYLQYANGNQEEKSWAAAAKTRANKTAAMYNEYVLKNSFVWEGNVPKDLLCQLDYIEEAEDGNN